MRFRTVYTKFRKGFFSHGFSQSVFFEGVLFFFSQAFFFSRKVFFFFFQIFSKVFFEALFFNFVVEYANVFAFFNKRCFFKTFFSHFQRVFFLKKKNFLTHVFFFSKKCEGFVEGFFSLSRVLFLSRVFHFFNSFLTRAFFSEES